jgi:hypothetical protein
LNYLRVFAGECGVLLAILLDELFAFFDPRLLVGQLIGQPVCRFFGRGHLELQNAIDVGLRQCIRDVSGQFRIGRLEFHVDQSTAANRCNRQLIQESANRLRLRRGFSHVARFRILWRILHRVGAFGAEHPNRCGLDTPEDSRHYP